MSRRSYVAVLAVAVVVVAGAIAWRLWPMPDPGPPFRVILIKPGNYYAEEAQEAADAGGKVPPEAIDLTADAASLPMDEVKRNETGQAFLALLRKLPGRAATIDGSEVFRLNDGQVITSAGGDALANGNTTVLVVPKDIVMMFDDEPTAFFQIKRRISGLQ